MNAKMLQFTVEETNLIELCPTIGKTSVESSIKKLVEEGVLIKHGSGRATFYTRA